MIEKLDDKYSLTTTNKTIIDKINEIIDVVNKLSNPRTYPVGTIPQPVQCTCNLNNTLCCPLHPPYMH